MAGSARVAKSQPDGYTFLIGNTGTHAYNQSLYKRPLYNAAEDFQPVGMMTDSPRILLARKDLPVNNLQEFVAYVKANHDKMQFGSAGVGSGTHLPCVLLNLALGVNVTHVPYRGAGPALNDALAGQVQVLFDNLPSSLPHIQAGKLRALAVGNDKRVSSIPDVPTFAETGHPLVNDPSWFGLIGPARLPPETVSRLHAALVATLKQPDAQKRLVDAASAPVGNSPEAFRKVVSDALDNTRKVVREANLKFE
jgi:tripartite-type tricarboxylate transporter receptor subunit TctC